MIPVAYGHGTEGLIFENSAWRLKAKHIWAWKFNERNIKEKQCDTLYTRPQHYIVFCYIGIYTIFHTFSLTTFRWQDCGIVQIGLHVVDI